LVTVTFKDLNGLRATAESLPSPLPEGVEWLVVDGGTGSDVESFLREDGRCRWWSEEDDGLYDAMNKGMAHADGRWVLWLNGGDVLEQPGLLACFVRELNRVAKETDDVLAVMADAAYVLADGTCVRRRAKPSWYIWHGMPSLHQAIAYPRVQAAEHPYPSSLQICGDYFLTASLFRSGVRFKRVDLALVRFAVGGISFQMPQRLLEEAAWIQADVLGMPWFLRRASTCIRAVNMSRIRSRQATAA
jgi:putative colanic acid biosynthesis glycosyltransferase